MIWLVQYPACGRCCYHYFCSSISADYFVIVSIPRFFSLLSLCFSFLPGHMNWSEKMLRTWHSDMYWFFFKSYSSSMTHCYHADTLLFPYNDSVEMGSEGRVRRSIYTCCLIGVDSISASQKFCDYKWVSLYLESLG